MIRTQISFGEDLYKRAKEVARKKGISLAELCRQSLAHTLADEPSTRPWMKFAGAIEGDIEDSETVDEVVYGRPNP